MGTILDTSVLIHAERRGLPLPFEGDDQLGIAAITASELLRGLLRADPANRARREAVVEGWLARLETIPFGLTVARLHAQLWTDLESAGILIGPADMQIAATALTLGWSVATLNVREFSRVPGLSVQALGRS